jgi:hypothetical protein
MFETLKYHLKSVWFIFQSDHERDKMGYGKTVRKDGNLRLSVASIVSESKKWRSCENTSYRGNNSINGSILRLVRCVQFLLNNFLFCDFFLRGHISGLSKLPVKFILRQANEICVLVASVETGAHFDLIISIEDRLTGSFGLSASNLVIDVDLSVTALQGIQLGGLRGT